MRRLARRLAVPFAMLAIGGRRARGRSAHGGCMQTIGGTGACVDADGHTTSQLQSATVTVTETPLP